eukprot:220759_1
MAFVDKLLTIFFCLFTTSAVSQLIYVSQNGNDTNDCGWNVEHSCGTLRFASWLVINNDEEVFASIIIHDGQNEDAIKIYTNSNPSPMYHPCLPLPFDFNFNIKKEITITFNSQHIEKMRDWFSNICYNITIHTTLEYYKQWLFQSRRGRPVVAINNLRADNYNTYDIQYGTLFDIGYAHFSCNHCIFENINFSVNMPAISMTISEGCLSLINTNIINVFSSYYFIDHNGSSVDLYNVSVVNSSFGQSVIALSHQSVITTSVYTTSLNIFGCTFVNISTQTSIVDNIYAGSSITSIINISNTDFTNILSGGIIQTVPFAVTEIHVNDIFISTQQVRNNTEVLFLFYDYITVTFSNVIVSYYYDLMTNCNDIRFICINPIRLIENYGKLKMYGTNLFKINVTLSDYYQYRDRFNLSTWRYLRFEDDHQEALIYNFAVLYIHNLKIHEIAFGVTIFTSHAGDMRLYNVTMHTSGFHPSMLQPSSIIYSFDTYGSGILHIDNCKLIGGHWDAIHIETIEQVYISNLQLTDSTIALNVLNTDEIVLTKSVFYQIGIFWEAVFIYYTIIAPPSFVNIETANSATLTDNSISCNNPYGLALFKNVDNVSLFNNIFTHNYSDSFYNFSSNYLDTQFLGGYPHYPFPYPGWITVLESPKCTSVINNQFNVYVTAQWFPYTNRYDARNTTVPWLVYYNNTGINCLSGNNFTNFAFVLLYTNLTSCARPELIECWEKKGYCDNGMYGTINEYINYESQFVVTTNITSIWKIFNNYIALDNIRIKNESIVVNDGNVFLLDSLLTYDESIDIWYDNSSCDLIYNQRYNRHSNYIAKLMVKCNENYNTSTLELIKSLNAPSTQMVDHFSTTKLNIYTINSTYSPGTLLHFDYQMTDILGNIVNTINITNNYSLIATVNNTDLSLYVTITIGKHGECDICENGIILFGANLLDKLGGPYNVKVQLKTPYLLLENEHIYLDIVGCPIGYGATENKYQCEKCAATKYNLQTNNTNQCLPCDSDSNKGIECFDGSIFVEYNYWIGINVNDQSLISSLCPHGYCCQNETKCEYKSSLQMQQSCSLNRDPTSFLCSKCIDGYSQVFQSAICKPCDGINVFPIIITLLFGVFVAIFILISQSNITKVILMSNKDSVSTNINRCKQRMKSFGKLLTNWNKSHFVTTMKLILFQGVLYYEQSLSQIIIHSNISTSNMSWWISLFNISILHNGANTNDENDGYCFYHGMTSKQSILSGFMVLMVILITLLLFKCMVSSMPFLGYLITPNYSQSFLVYLLLCVG